MTAQHPEYFGIKNFLLASVLSLQLGIESDVNAQQPVTAQSVSVHRKLLERHPIVFLFDDDASGPVVNPSEFAAGGQLQYPAGGVGHSLPKRFETLSTVETVANFCSWLTISNANSGFSASINLAPDGLKLNQWRKPDTAAEMNKRAVSVGKGLFADIRMVEGETNVYTLKYILFLAYNKASGPGGYGDHEGDWICVDLQIETGTAQKPDDFASKVTCAIFHQHGSHTIVPARSLRKDKAGTIQVYLEQGSNEPFPEAGEAEPVLNGYGVVRRHMGQGTTYSSLGKVRDLQFDKDLDTTLVIGFQGRWGALSVAPQPWKKLLGDVTNPPSPVYQQKMWNRKGLPPETRWHPCE